MEKVDRFQSQQAERARQNARLNEEFVAKLTAEKAAETQRIEDEINKRIRRHADAPLPTGSLKPPTTGLFGRLFSSAAVPSVGGRRTRKQKRNGRKSKKHGKKHTKKHNKKHNKKHGKKHTKKHGKKHSKKSRKH